MRREFLVSYIVSCVQDSTSGFFTTRSISVNVKHEPKVVPVGDSPSTPIGIKVSPTRMDCAMGPIMR